MRNISKVSFKIIFVSLWCVFVNNKQKCLELAAEIRLRLAMEVMLGNWMGDIFFFQSVLERLYFSRIYFKYVLMIQFCPSKTTTQFKTSCNTMLFVFHGVCHSPGTKSLAFMMSVSCYSSVTDYVILSEQHHGVGDLHQPQINF